MRVGISILVVAFSGRSDCTDSLPRRYTIECLLAGYSKLSLYDGYFPRSRVPYNLCRNHEWLACAAQGKLPGMDGALTSSKSIIFVSSPLEVLTRNNEWLDQCPGSWLVGCTPVTNSVEHHSHFLDIPVHLYSIVTRDPRRVRLICTGATPLMTCFTLNSPSSPRFARTQQLYSVSLA